MHHVVALSGGKDSTALAIALASKEPRQYIYICTPTGDELPEMESHWDCLSRLLKSPIHRIDPGYSLTELIYRKNMIPNFRARFCTGLLKILPDQNFLDNLGECVLYVGLRADEPDRGGGVYAHHDQRFPLREWEWELKDVLSYLDNLGVVIPDRTDCAMCFNQRLSEWRSLWLNHPKRYAHAESLEAEFGHTFRSPSRDTWPAGLKDLRLEFAKGRIPRGSVLQRDLFKKCRVCSL
jgi:hypothetical protein